MLLTCYSFVTYAILCFNGVKRFSCGDNFGDNFCRHFVVGQGAKPIRQAIHGGLLILEIVRDIPLRSVQCRMSHNLTNDGHVGSIPS